MSFRIGSVTAASAFLAIASMSSLASADDGGSGLSFTPRFWASIIVQTGFEAGISGGSGMLNDEPTFVPLSGGTVTYAPPIWAGAALSTTVFYGKGDSRTNAVLLGPESDTGFHAMIGEGTSEQTRLDVELLLQMPVNEDRSVNFFVGARTIQVRIESNVTMRGGGDTAINYEKDANSLYLGEVGIGIVTPLSDESRHMFFANGMIVAGWGDKERNSSFSFTGADGAGFSESGRVSDNGMSFGGDVNVGYGYALDFGMVSARYRAFGLVTGFEGNDTVFVHGPEVNASIRF